jgi:tripartite-type tricarboxylate transporter receptor subunit TctC
MKRVLLVVLGSVAGVGLFFVTSGHGQNYPTKPVRIIAASTGTTGDLLARYLAQQLTERWGKQVVVENRSGAGAVIAAEVAAKAAPDGYTLHLGQLASFSAAVSLYKKLPYDPVKDFAPISLYAQVPLMLVAHPSVPAANLREFIDFVKKRPGAVNVSSAGNGTGSHLTTELLSHVAGLKLVHVPYKGTGAAMIALVSGEAQASSIVVPSALPQVKAGKVRAYAITSKNRFAGAPEIPTASEAGLPGFESTTWFGMFVPTRTPAALVDRLNREMVEILRMPSAQAWLLAQGAEPAPSTPGEFAAFIKSETVKWKKVIEVSGTRVD